MRSPHWHFHEPIIFFFLLLGTPLSSHLWSVSVAVKISENKCDFSSEGISSLAVPSCYTACPFMLYGLSLHAIRPVSSCYTACPFMLYGLSLHAIWPVPSCYTACPFMLYGLSLHAIRPVSSCYRACPFMLYGLSLHAIRPVPSCYTAKVSCCTWFIQTHIALLQRECV